jgi:hypothetical protein
VALGAAIGAAREILDTGTFDTFANAASFAELTELFEPT